MKSATIPSLRVDPELRRAAEEILHEGETLSHFVEQSLRDGIERRRLHAEFISRGLVSRDHSRTTGHYVDSGAVVERLESILTNAKTKAARSAG